MAGIRDLAGKEFGRLKVLRFAGTRGRNSYWLCRCVCGTEKEIGRQNLKAGTQSCGCLARESTAKRSRKHHMRGSGEWVSWKSMNGRCFNPKDRAYAYYGGRGITVCDRWHGSFLAFFQDMGLKPGPGHTLDRLDNDGNYEPGNCRWATKAEQSRNRRGLRKLQFRGKTQTLTEWGRELGIKRVTLIGRLSRGWSVEKALACPVRR